MIEKIPNYLKTVFGKAKEFSKFQILQIITVIIIIIIYVKYLVNLERTYLQTFKFKENKFKNKL